MSFRGNGQHDRYGYVPPAQYGPSGTANPNFPTPGLYRQTSFDNGDDATFGGNNGRHQAGGPPVPMRPTQAEYYQANNAQSPHSPAQSSAGNLTPALSGYQHQYQPFPNAGAQSPPQAQYNPQNFPRSQSQSQAHTTYGRPQPAYNTTPTLAHQPYVPSAYQAPTAAPARHTTVSGYGQHNNNQQYGSAPVPQSPGYYQPNMQYPPYALPTQSRPSPQPSYEQPLASPGYPPRAPNSAPIPPRQILYTPPTTSTAYNGQYSPVNSRNPVAPVAPQATPYPDYPEYSQGHNSHNSSVDNSSYTNRVSRSGSNVTPPVSMPMGPSIDMPTGLGLQRHPTHRPLPGPPAHEDRTGDDDDWNSGQQGRSEEDIKQEQLFSDILRASSSRSDANGDLLDSELNRYDSKASTLGAPSGVNRYASTASTLNQDYEFEDEESDAEAAAGLEAMRIAEEQDAFGGGGLSFGNYDSHPPPQNNLVSPEDSSDSDYKHHDLSLVGGGYDARLSYGDELGGHTGHSSEMEDQSRPLPTAYDLGRSDSYVHTTVAGLGGMTDYSIPGAGSIHPFPAFEPAKLDGSTLPSPSRPSSSSQRHRLSFDEGDEQVPLHLRMPEMPHRSDSDSPTRNDMPELFYHPGPDVYNRPLPAVPSITENRTPQLQAPGAYRNLQHSQSYSSPTESRPYVPINPDAYSGQAMLAPGGQYVPRSTSLNSHSSTPQTLTPVRSKTDAEERQLRQKAARGTGSRNVSGLDGYTIDTPQSTVGLDLPSLPDGARKKKFLPSRLSSPDFKKCLEPWALSAIAAWVKELAGGETGEGEPDLRQKTIEDGLVALFTHKVPTMNIADAETISQRVVKSMLQAGILLPEEEWVKFGPGSISGVLWQLTGSGCYSPKLHEHEVPGRCYSHHCTRTLKKINLQAQQLEPQRKEEDWSTFFGIKKEMVEGISNKEIQRQNNLHEIVTSEDRYMGDLDVLRVLYRDDLLSWQPPIIAPTKIARFVSSVFGKVEQIKEVNENHLLPQLKYRQKEQGPWIIGFSDIFREWIRKARTAYIEYAAGFPYAAYLIRKEADRNLLFKQFLEQASKNKLSNRLDWNNYLKVPITRLQRYTLLLDSALKNMTQETEERAILVKAIAEIHAVTLECDAKVDEQTKKVEMIEIQSKLILRPGMERVELNLEHLGRQLIYKGDLQRPGNNRFTWLDTHAMLFDNYLVLSKTVVKQDGPNARRKEIYDVSKVPIPMQLLVLESANDDPVVRGGVKGIGGITPVTKTSQLGGSDSRLNLNRPSTNGLDRSSTSELTQSSTSLNQVTSNLRVAPAAINNDVDAKAMYPFRVKHLGQTEVYTLYASSAQSRQIWCEKILEAKTRHATDQFEQKAEPFRLNVMADTAFANDATAVVSYRTGVSIPGTPLERAIRKMENTYPTVPRPAPVCRAAVNCATAFNAYGKQMIAIGTDYGVFLSDANNPRGWTRSIQIARVTQIAILEEFSLCLIIADKSLIAYHLDVVVPVSNYPAPNQDSARRAPQKLSGAKDVSFFATARMKDRTLVFYKKRESMHSTFKVLEPVFQKSTEKKSRIFGKKFGGNTEFFREFDEFYIPTECFTINLFHTYIAISTLKGFELMTLDKKVPMSIPDMRNPAISGIATRLQGQKPLGMFRLSDAEFLLCYEECGVYVDKHGEVSRSVILEFVGRAKTAAMYGAYLVLFDNDFVEVRNAENGRLRQVIAGSGVKCLDYGVNPLGAGKGVGNGVGGGGDRRTLKLVMSHPEINGSQIVLEMVLNEGQSD